ncbi:MAG: FMN-binding glutamate synthase family protein [Coriobacteriaceae bacterium]|nr:FMN-binding glutamate synthase family protein [Coriobacteriaceae bacterium]
MTRYQCPMCGWVYDEEAEGAPLSELDACPMCGTPAAQFIPLEEEASAEPSGEAEEGPLAIPAELRRFDPSIRHLSTIHELAENGRAPDGAMATTLPLPAWEDILVLGAQLDPMPLAEDAEVDISCTIGGSAARPLTLEGPVFVSHMSFGALSAEAKVALARGASAVGTAMCSGEGGILPAEREASTRYIFEIAPLRYSVSDESLRAADAIEIKIGQGTKPGMGGHLPGKKVTEEIARIRGRQPGEDIVSPSTFPGVESVEDLRALVDEMRERSGGAPVGIKLAAGHIERDIDRAHAAGADFITIDGRGGATGASPVMLRDAASVPTMYALVRARRRLDALGSRASLVITGGLRVASDVVKALALGADAVALASASLMALGCQQYRICGSGMCPVGIATQDPELRERRGWDAAAQRVENFYRATFDDLKMFCRVMGHERISELSVDDLVTVNPDLAERLGIPRA